MFRRTEARAESGGAASPAPSAQPMGELPPVPPRADGGLEAMLGFRPVFRTAMRGYERMQVDNYVDWAETELTVARRQLDDLLTRFGICSAELEISRRLLASSPKGPDVSFVTERVTEILRLASDEAAALTAAGAEEADRLLAEARIEADARLRKAHHIKEAAVASSDALREQAERDRAEAAALLERARREADEIIREAASESNRLATESAQELAREEDRARRERAAAEAEAAARLAAVQEEVADLRRQRDEARESMRRLTDGIGQALEAVTGTATPDDLVVLRERRHAVAS